LVKRTLYVCDVDSVKLFRKRRVYGFIQSLWMYAEKPGMGVEPIYSGSLLPLSEIELFSPVILLFLPIMHFYTTSKHLKWFVIDHSKHRITRTSMKTFQRVPEISILLIEKV